MQPGRPPLPRTGEVYFDSRSPDRALRVTWHEDSGVVVLSVWRGNVCTASFQLAIGEVPDLIDALRAGLDSSYADALAAHRASRLSDAG